MGKYDKYVPAPSTGSKYDKYLPAKEAEPEGLLFQIPGVGPYLKSADEAVQSVIGRPPNAQEGLQGLSDMARVGVDAFSMGGADYAAGGDQAELTRQAKKRLGGGASALVEFGGSSLTPTGVSQKIGRGAQILGHGISGGAQNIANEWTHGERDLSDLAWAGATGSGLSAAGSAITDPIAAFFSKRSAAKALPSTESLKPSAVDETLDAADQRYQQYLQTEKYAKAKEIDEAAPVKKGLFNIHGESSDAPSMERFQKVLDEGEDSYSDAEKVVLERLAKGTPMRDIGEMARRFSPARNVPVAGLSTALGVLTGGVGWPAAGTAAMEGMSALGRSATQSDVNELQSLLKTGKSLTADPARVAEIKDKMAQMMAAATRTGYDPLLGGR